MVPCGCPPALPSFLSVGNDCSTVRRRLGDIFGAYVVTKEIVFFQRVELEATKHGYSLDSYMDLWVAARAKSGVGPPSESENSGGCWPIQHRCPLRQDWRPSPCLLQARGCKRIRWPRAGASVLAMCRQRGARSLGRPTGASPCGTRTAATSYGLLRRDE